MNISIFGMGYVGLVSAACLARDGHTVIGVDPVESKIRDLSQGLSPISEPGISELMANGHTNGRLLATTDPEKGVHNADMIWICVGTPSGRDGSVELSSVKICIEQISTVLKNNAKRPLIVLRSTIPPGTTRDCIIPLLESVSGLKAGKDIQVCFHPEFLRESSAIYDFDNPPKIVIGETHEGAADLLYDLYSDFDAPKFRILLEEAEMVKYCDNIFHALKITFANEVGAIAKAFGVDARRVAEVFVSDTKLNISAKYLQPGFAYGGSCLPKDVRAINRLAVLKSIPVPLLGALQSSNNRQIDMFVQRVLNHNPDAVGMVGIAFKKNTDDMRESPFVAVAKRLLGEGIDVKVYDPSVNPQRLVGSNKEAARRALGHLEKLLVPAVDHLDRCNLIILNHDIVENDHIESWLKQGIKIIDIANTKWPDRQAEYYEGIAW
ncbi:nucleotide sugar dehydrogenase [candidate division KSB1 bacterium]|nr:nucleotide sugar dehydrogenase [candidate division KSB1 bacterium]